MKNKLLMFLISTGLAILFIFLLVGNSNSIEMHFIGGLIVFILIAGIVFANLFIFKLNSEKTGFVAKSIGITLIGIFVAPLVIAIIIQFIARNINGSPSKSEINRDILIDKNECSLLQVNEKKKISSAYYISAEVSCGTEKQVQNCIWWYSYNSKTRGWVRGHVPEMRCPR